MADIRYHIKRTFKTGEEDQKQGGKNNDVGLIAALIGMCVVLGVALLVLFTK